MDIDYGTGKYMTEYLKKSFSVGAPGSQQYRDNWDAIFNKDEDCVQACSSMNDLVESQDLSRQLRDSLKQLVIPLENLWDIIDESEEISVEPWKWGHNTTYVYQKQWMFTCQFHSQEGIQEFGPVTAVRVRPIEVTKISWQRY